MSLDFTESSLIEVVQRTFDNTEDARVKQVFVALVQHVHDFAREVRLTGDEWFTAIDFLTRVGKINSDTRQEYVLLSDLLGLSALVDLINHEQGSSATDSTVLGPFYVEDRPSATNGADISSGIEGMPLFVSGQVLDPQDKSIPEVRVDTWHSDGNGFYDVQQADKLDHRLAMRALLTSDAQGRFWYRSITPRYYPVPTDGPCGEILRAAGRSAMRPEHVHFWFHAEGYEPLITTLFRAGDPYLDSDAVFGAKRSLVADFVQHEPGIAPDGSPLDEPFQTLSWTFTLNPSSPPR